jgi:hypothetical protein
LTATLVTVAIALAALFVASSLLAVVLVSTTRLPHSRCWLIVVFSPPFLMPPSQLSLLLSPLPLRSPPPQPPQPQPSLPPLLPVHAAAARSRHQHHTNFFRLIVVLYLSLASVGGDGSVGAQLPPLGGDGSIVVVVVVVAVSPYSLPEAPFKGGPSPTRKRSANLTHHAEQS